MISMIVKDDNNGLAIRRNIDRRIEDTVAGGIIANGDRRAPVVPAIG